MKGQAAKTATLGVFWSYIKVLQKGFEDLHPDSFEALNFGEITQIPSVGNVISIVA